MIRIRVPDAGQGHVAFTYSPLLECLLSLHVLVDRRQHALQHTWIRAMRALDPALRRQLDAFRFLYKHTLPDLVVPTPEGWGETFESALERLVGHPPELLLEGFGRPLFDHGGRYGAKLLDVPAVRQTMLAQAAAYGTESRRLAALLLEEPYAFACRFMAVLIDYWHSAFMAEWNRIESLLHDSVVESRRILDAGGVPALLGRLPPHVRIDGQGLLVDLPHEHDVVISPENPLLLTPSVFVWPHVRIACDAPWSTAVIYPAPSMTRDAAARIPPADLLLVLRAIGDDTRLRVLRLIAERPRTTQELAPLVGLSVTGLSKSLRRLADAGLVSSRREGYFVVYSLERARFEGVAAALADFLDG